MLQKRHHYEYIRTTISPFETHYKIVSLSWLYFSYKDIHIPVWSKSCTALNASKILMRQIITPLFFTSEKSDTNSLGSIEKHSWFCLKQSESMLLYLMVENRLRSIWHIKISNKLKVGRVYTFTRKI